MVVSSPVFLAPSKLDAYNPHELPANQSASGIPQIFLDAMHVRQQVFVQEQGVPPEGEFDEDDSRSCHWVLYANGQAGEPIGTVRMVPYPQDPHPLPGGVYATVDGVVKLVGVRDQTPNGDTTQPEPASGTASSLPEESEPYVKIGRLAVSRSHRKQGHGDVLLKAALEWMRTHPDFFDQPSAPSTKFNGLVYIHAQVTALPFYQRAGFAIDERMGKWWEEEMLHVGMFKRLDIERS